MFFAAAFSSILPSSTTDDFFSFSVSLFSSVSLSVFVSSGFSSGF